VQCYDPAAMTVDISAPLRRPDPPAATALADRVASHSEVLAGRMVAELSRRIELYAHLPKEQLDGDILSVCRHNIHVFLRILRTGSEPAPAELEVIRTSAASRADEGMPLDALLRAYYVGFSLVWEHFRREAVGEEREELLSIATAAMAYIEEVTSQVTRAYFDEYAIIASTRRDVRRSLVEALLSGQPAEDLAAQAGVRLHAGYAVVALAFGPSADEGCPEVEKRVAARRKVRRVIAHLESEAGSDCLTVLDGSGGAVLLPAEEVCPKDDPSGVPELLERLSEVARCPMIAGYACRAGVSGIATSSAEAKEVLHLAQKLGLPPGAYRRHDLLFEYAISRDTESMAALVALLEPLSQGRADLLETVEVYFACGLERQRTAAALHVHPNTLDYRLRRARALTGIDISSPSGVSEMRAALVAHHLAPAHPPMRS